MILVLLVTAMVLIAFTIAGVITGRGNLPSHASGRGGEVQPVWWPQFEPVWWPQFEREFRAYAASQRGRSARREDLG